MIGERKFGNPSINYGRKHVLSGCVGAWVSGRLVVIKRSSIFLTSKYVYKQNVLISIWYLKLSTVFFKTCVQKRQLSHLESYVIFSVEKI